MNQINLVDEVKQALTDRWPQFVMDHPRLAKVLDQNLLLEQAGAPEALSAMLSPIALDALTVADDPGWLDGLQTEHNLPDYVLPGLRALYADTPPR